MSILDPAVLVATVLYGALVLACGILCAIDRWSRRTVARHVDAALARPAPDPLVVAEEFRAELAALSVQDAAAAVVAHGFARTIDAEWAAGQDGWAAS